MWVSARVSARACGCCRCVLWTLAVPHTTVTLYPPHSFATAPPPPFSQGLDYLGLRAVNYTSRDDAERVVADALAEHGLPVTALQRRGFIADPREAKVPR